MNAIDILALGLQRFSLGLPTPQPLSDPAEMIHVRKQVQFDHDAAGVAADSRMILTAVAEFRRTGEVSGFRDLKYVCLGVGVLDAKGWCVLEDGQLRARVSSLVQAREETRQRLRCFQALLSSFWTFPINDKATSEQAKIGWRELRSWLAMEFSKMTKCGMQMPQWFDTLGMHSELLTNQPCEKFGAELLTGNSSNLNEAMDGLAIPMTSWVLEEAVFAQMRAASGQPDASFRLSVPTLLPIAMGIGGVALGEGLKIRCVAELVARYARCHDRPEDISLRDAAVTVIGNPWLRRANWDAWVIDPQNRPDDQAREMINGWLKRRLITDFFEMLSVDGSGDPRRVDYWLRFEPYIEDMWFALGANALERTDENFADFKSRAKGRLLDFKSPTRDNNGFVMRIGQYLAVEFGAKGNAFYFLKWDSLDQQLMRSLVSGAASTVVYVANLKPKLREFRLMHRDSADATWEEAFDKDLCPLIGHRPKTPPYAAGQQIGRSSSSRPSTKATLPSLSKQVSRRTGNGMNNESWNLLVKENTLLVRDNRSKGGALWILGTSHPWKVEEQLKSWGFKLASRGWYRE